MKKSHEKVERSLVDDFLKGSPPPGTPLESERDLAVKYAVSRATVREALQQLEKSGWISKQQRHATIVNDFWSKGDLELLTSIEKNSESFPLDLAIHILELRVQFAPDYARKAVENNGAQLIEMLGRVKRLSDSCSAVAKFDWELHLAMAILSGNRIYPLIMNSSAPLYDKLRKQFFASSDIRAITREYYVKLLNAAQERNGDKAEEITRCAMRQRLSLFTQQVEEAMRLSQEAQKA